MWATELFVTPTFCEGHGHPSTEGHGRPPVVASQPPDEKACAGHALRTPSGRNFYRGPAQRLVCAEKAQTAFGVARSFASLRAHGRSSVWPSAGSHVQMGAKMKALHLSSSEREASVSKYLLTYCECTNTLALYNNSNRLRCGTPWQLNATGPAHPKIKRRSRRHASHPKIKRRAYMHYFDWDDQ